ncbi:filamentous hemagglutinin N-terminal domain-containing protein [Pandoraea pnomenusa]|uniref:filamentous hemagglutinin N-terminal domain-containing protein n=1 Tax=Pandoraea pnomenusa TaxID=93220 RepID=UPI00333F7525
MPCVSHRFLLRPLSTAALSALVALGFPVAAWSQIVAAPGPHAPGVGVTPNGLPLVNITTPSAAGVSQNQYRQFDVPTQGAILNNARTIVQTQMGGLVPGNPNLTGAPARIIVNQVTGALPSNLAGYLEVAGSRAEVIVSNPNGITCNGCGFVNTSRGVLTTGVPVFGGSGSLEAFRVTDGRIRIAGGGLNAGNLEHAALLARAVEVNAAVHAQRLDVITGLNDIDAATFDIRDSQTSSGGTPTFALDLSRLGGMYAGKIRLIGTEAGVGVNLDGQVTAGRGALTLSSAGRLQVGGKLQSQDDLRVMASGDLSIDGDVMAEAQLALRTQGNLLSAGNVRGARDVALDAAGTWRHTGKASAGRHFVVDAAAIASSGVIAAGANADGTQGATGNITLSTTGLLQAGGNHAATGDIRLSAKAIDLTGSTSTTLRGLQMDTRGGDITMSRATTSVGGTTRITGRGDVVHDGATLRTSGLFIDAAGLRNDKGRIEQWGAMSPLQITLSGSMRNRGGQILANSTDLRLDSARLDNTDGKIEHAGAGRFALDVGNVENVGGAVATNGVMSIEANDWRNDRGTLSAKQSLTATLHGKFTNTAGLMQSGGLFSLKANDIRNLGGRMLALSHADLHLFADTVIENGRLDGAVGEIAGRGNVRLDATSLINSGNWTALASLFANAAGDLLNVGGRIVARHQVSVAARGAFDNTRGTVTADEALTLEADAADNSLGEIQSRSIAVSARTLTNRTGKLIQTGTGAQDLARLRVADRIDNHAGSMHLAARDATIDTSGFENTDGTVAHAGNGTLSISGKSLDNRGGRIGTNGDLLLDARSVDNDNGLMTAMRTLKSTIAGQLSNVSGEMAATSVSLNVGDTFDNHSGSVEASDTLRLSAARINNAKGKLLNSGHGQTAMTVQDALDNMDGGTIAANATLSVDAGSLDNTGGRLHAGDSLTLKVAKDVTNDTGYLAGGSRLNIDIRGSLINRVGHVSAHDALRLYVAEQFDNTDGKVEVGAASGQMDVSAGTLDNAGGRFANAGTGAIDMTIAGRLRNRASAGRTPDDAGSIAGNGAINVRAGGIENIDGARMAAGTSLSLTSIGAGGCWPMNRST